MVGDFFRGDLVRHESLGMGKVEDTSGFGEGQRCFVFFSRGEKSGWFPKTVLARLSGEESAAYEFVKLAIRELKEEDAPKIELANRWEGGEMVFKPADSALAPHSIPVETFFHKIVMVRDRLRVMEQQINASKKLSEEDKVELQQYITRIYGSLTSFNFLFRNKADNFVGQKGEK